MIRLTFLIALLLSFSTLKAQTDTSAYETQRAKINALLAERSSRFGQYEQSLNERTGIFGFQTKQDIRNSNEILRQITLNDNTIFRELKVLLDYKDLQVQQVKSSVTDNTERLNSYMAAIKKLQDQNQLLRDQLNKPEPMSSAWYIVIILLIGIGAYFYQQRRKLKTPRHENVI
ncbi:MAG: hypothetical protein EOO88_04905 [Pedobacter sp.]|nr:MAG: hypothetical protein EOO88_04905 [Pedobacter sp.]